MTTYNYAQIAGILLMIVAHASVWRFGLPASIGVSCGFLAAWLPLGLYRW